MRIAIFSFVTLMLAGFPLTDSWRIDSQDEWLRAAGDVTDVKIENGQVYLQEESVVLILQSEEFSRKEKVASVTFRQSPVWDNWQPTDGKIVPDNLVDAPVFVPVSMGNYWLLGRLKGADIYLDTVTVTGTENLMMAAVTAKGTTVLRNAAREPEVVALADTLIKMGADIEGAGTSIITIHGVSSLTPAETVIIPDRIETGTFMMAAILTRGNITLLGCEPDHLGATINKLRLTGADIETAADTIQVSARGDIHSVDVKTQPYPGFPTDMQAQFMVLMSIADGTSMISETIFENRFIHVSELIRMGADIKVDGNVAIVKGMPNLSAAPVMATDLRASASLILAGLVAEGTTEINRVYHLDRGYEAIVKKFACLGADIKRIK